MSTRQWSMALIAAMAIFVLMVSGVSAHGAAMPGVFQSPPPSDRTGTIGITGVTAGDARVNREFITEMIFGVAGTTGPGMTGAEVYIGYDPLLVAPVQMPGVSGNAESVPDFFGAPNLTINEVITPDCAPLRPGQPCLHLVVAGPAQFNQSGVVIRFHWLGLSTGTAACQVLNPVTAVPPQAAPRSSFINADGYIIPLTQFTCQPVTILAPLGSITGNVLRQGVPAVPNTGGGTQACTKITTSGGLTTYTDVAGNFTFTNVPLGTYSVSASYGGYLTAQKTSVVVSTTQLSINIGGTRLLGGDVIIPPDTTSDGRINILDIGRIISMFTRVNQPVGSANPANCALASDESSDINDDGVVNISDLAIAAGNWSLIGPRPW